MKTMSTMASTPSSSSTTTSSSSLTRTPPPTSSPSAAQRRAEASTEQNSCYFPGCRKDTNCNCDICLASINATLDLIPHSSRSSLTKLSSSFSARRRPLFGPEKTPLAKPEHKSISTPQSPPIQSTAKSWPIKEKVVAEKATAIRTKVLVVLVVFGLFLIVDKGVPKMVIWRGFEPKLKGDTLSKGLVGELRERIGLVQERIEEIINEKVVDCSSMKLGWQFHQEGQNFFHWKCVVYKSWVEEVSIWGSPLRSSGLLPTAFSPRSLSVVSGKITEWSDGKVMSTMRTSNNSSSWTLKPWNKSVMQLEANTWVLEYKRSAWLEGQGLLEFAGEMVRLKNLKMVLAQQTSLFFSVHKQVSKEIMVPT